mmetsp:Transcript_27607/g.87732  ORF Transcript_27607/g.87732 Transcript_27607/m.87732 type:complete len:535 (-) Transcript_27607:85-1689(-)
MIKYDEDWLVPLVFRLRGSLIQRSSLFAFPAAAFSLILVTLDTWYPDLRQNAGLLEISGSQLWSSSTAVIFILLGFRTNRAMSRFWEGTGLLHQMRGEWFDSVSCCVTFSRSSLDAKPQEVWEFRHTLVRLMSLCHGSALDEISHESSDPLQTIDAYGLDNRTLDYLQRCNSIHHFNRVEVLLHLIQSLITKNLQDGVLQIPAPILSRVYQTLSRGFVNLLNAKKITDTHFPFPYVQLISMILLVHVILTPVLLSSLIHNQVWAPIFSFVSVFCMFYINFVSVELENPFGDDANDLPMEHFQSEMNNCLLMLLQDEVDIVPHLSLSRVIADYATLEKTIRHPQQFSTCRVDNFTLDGSMNISHGVSVLKPEEHRVVVYKSEDNMSIQEAQARCAMESPDGLDEQNTPIAAQGLKHSIVDLYAPVPNIRAPTTEIRRASIGTSDSRRMEAARRLHDLHSIVGPSVARGHPPVSPRATYEIGSMRRHGLEASGPAVAESLSGLPKLPACQDARRDVSLCGDMAMCEPKVINTHTRA